MKRANDPTELSLKAPRINFKVQKFVTRILILILSDWNVTEKQENFYSILNFHFFFRLLNLVSNFLQIKKKLSKNK